MTTKTKRCKGCDKPLTRKKGENSYNWPRRKYCDQDCRYTHTLKLQRDATAAKPQKETESRRFRPEPVFTEAHDAIIYGRTP